MLIGRITRTGMCCFAGLELASSVSDPSTPVFRAADKAAFMSAASGATRGRESSAPSVSHPDQGLRVTTSDPWKTSLETHVFCNDDTSRGYRRLVAAQRASRELRRAALMDLEL